MSSTNPFKNIGTTLRKKLASKPNQGGSAQAGHPRAAIQDATESSRSSISNRTTTDLNNREDQGSTIAIARSNPSDAADSRTLPETQADVDQAAQSTAVMSKDEAMTCQASNKNSETKLARTGHLAYEGVKESLRAVQRCSDFFPPLKSATQGVLEIIERYDAVKAIPKELQDIASKLDLLVRLLTSVDGNDSIKDRLNGLATTFEEKAKVIANKLERSIGARIIESTEDKAFLARELNTIGFAIKIATLDVNLNVNKNVYRVQETVSELRDAGRLDKLKYVEGAEFNHEDRQGCMDGTRNMLLADLRFWATDSDNKHVFWTNGMAGTGKTAVAETFCHHLAREGLLGSSFFCSRKKPDRRGARLIIPTLARGLARVYPKFLAVLLQVLKDDRNFTGLGIEDQYQMLILQPAEKAFSGSSTTFVLVIDALDECEDGQTAQMLLKTALLQKPTCGLRLFFTSRPEPNILKGLRSGAYASLRLHDIEAHLVEADIAIFVNSRLKAVEDLNMKYGSTWPPPEVQTIVDRAGKFFLYAAVAVAYVSDEYGDPLERLSKLASSNPPSNAFEAVDKVYAYVLDGTFHQKLDDDEIARIKACLSILVATSEPRTVDECGAALGMTAIQVRKALSSLHSVIYVPTDDSQLITLYHPSFAEYISSDTRSAAQPWLVDPPKAEPTPENHPGADLDSVSPNHDEASTLSI